MSVFNLPLVFLQVTAEEIKDNRAITLELEAKNLDKKVTLLFILSTLSCVAVLIYFIQEVH